MTQKTEAPPILRAAGVLFVAEGKLLLVQRSPDSDFPGTWCCPGGGVEDGETFEQAARRECVEEIGRDDIGNLTEISRFIRGNVDYVTFLSRGDSQFTPTLNNEHTGYCWVDLNEIPPNTHPGVLLAIKRMAMDELAIAEAMAFEGLVSPQVYMNVTLFDIRITGTGAAYRAGHEEFCWRNPEDYLNDRFLARCNGLPVIFEHPEETMLNSDEHKDRIVGSIFLPYIKGDEVWGIAKIYDDDTITILRATQMSTSPGVVLGKLSGSIKTVMDDGTDLLIEGRPILVDHIAICEAGVWDKAQAPSGVSINGDTEMADKEDMKEDRKDAEMEEKKDADAGTQLDMTLSRLDEFCSKMDARLDALEKKDSKKDQEDEVGMKDADKEEEEKKDGDPDPEEDEAEELAADSKKKDTKKDEEKEDLKELKDSIKKMLADNAELRKQLKAVETKIPRQLTDADHDAFAEIQSRADSVHSAFGERAPRPLDGESTTDYRRRLASGLKKHSPDWKDQDLRLLPDSALSIAEKSIYQHASAAAMAPIDLEPGMLREVTKTDHVTGQRQTVFHGRNTFIASTKRPPMRAEFTSHKVH